MGCGASAQGEAASTIHRLQDGRGPCVGILVRSAKHLRKADTVTNSDPYVLARLGRAGSAWHEKAPTSERRSNTVSNDNDPEWRFGFLAEVPVGESSATWELHLRVFDEDLLTPDDPLGELAVPLQLLEQHEHEAKEYPLTGAKAQTGSSVSIMVGSRVEQALLDDLEQKVSQGWLSGGVRSAVDFLAGFMSSLAATPIYYINLLEMGRAWSRPLTAGQDPSAAWFKKKTTDPKTGQDTRRWNGPEAENSFMLTGQIECVEVLSSLGNRLGTSNGNGEVYHPNSLGVAKQNPGVWPEAPWKGIGLAAPQETHAKLRPLLVKLCGPSGRWSSRWLDEEAALFFRGRMVIDVSKDLHLWVAKVQHEVLLGIKLTESECEEFVDMKLRMLIIAGAPTEATQLSAARSVLKFDRTVEEKARWLERYKSALPAHLPETAALGLEDFVALTSAIMDALVFAGGASIPQILSQALAIPWSQWGDESLPEDFCLCNVQMLLSYIWEVIRCFPPVACVPLTERSYGSAPETTLYLNLQMGQRDDRAWGLDAGDFRLRPLAEYHRNSIGFAEPALAPGLADANARACPAKDLALGMGLSFMRAFARTIQESAEMGPLMHRKVWIARAIEANESGMHRPLEPAEITLNMYGTSSFLLVRDIAAHMAYPEVVESTREELFKTIPLEEVQAMKQLVAQKNKFDQVNLHTKSLYASVSSVMKQQRQGQASVVGPPIDATIKEENVWTGPFPGFRMITNNDAEESLLDYLRYLSQNVGFAALAAVEALPLGEEEQVYFDSPVEAAVAIDATFGGYLPPQFNSWADLHTDGGTVQLCVFGLGAWYLRGARSADAAGHEVPVGAAFEVNLEEMSQYETREPWVRYGHTAYLGPAPSDGSSAFPQDVLGIWVCHSSRLVRPGDADWEQAKAGFRSSLGTSVTLKEHLATSHWIAANQLQVAARETLRADSPLRRLLRQFYYNTADINNSAKEFLLPANQFGFRTFGFSESGWGSYFTNIWASYAWKPFPEMLKGRDLPEALLAQLPLKQDGELLWNAFANYTRKYLKVFYPEDNELLSDAGVLAFWNHFDEHHRWHLPALSRESLTSLIADLMWWVTAGHEYLGSIVEYLPALNGLPAKLVAGSAVADVQTLAQTLVLISLTGLQEPALMDDWTHIFMVESWPDSRREEVLRIVREFQVDLDKVSREIDERNIKRERSGQKRFNAFNPRLLETSVSI